MNADWRLIIIITLIGIESINSTKNTSANDKNVYVLTHQDLAIDILLYGE